MDGHQLALGGSQAIMHTVGTGRAPLHHGTELGAGRGDSLALGAVAARHQYQLVHRRVGDKQGTACLQYRAPIGQAVAEFIKSHAAGGPRGHDNGSYSWQPLLRHTAAPPYT